MHGCGAIFRLDDQNRLKMNKFFNFILLEFALLAVKLIEYKYFSVFDSTQHDFLTNYRHIIDAVGNCSTLFSCYLLNCNVVVVFLVLALKVNIFLEFDLIGINLLFMVLTSKTIGKQKKIPVFVLIIVSGTVSMLCCVAISVVYTFVVFYCFFVLLFLWLRNHDIGSDGAEAANDAMLTVGLFMVSSLITFIAGKKIFGTPKLSGDFYSFYSTLSTFPILSSKLTIATLPFLFIILQNTDGEKKVFALSCYLIAELFRFYPISSENIINISAGFFDIGSLILMNGCYKKKISYLLFILYFSICILHYIWFSVLMKKTPYKFPF